MVDGVVLRPTDAPKRTVGSNVRYKDVRRYSDDNGDRRFKPTSRLLLSNKLIMSFKLSNKFTRMQRYLLLIKQARKSFLKPIMI